MKPTIFFNSQHSPVGAFASFTLEAKGAKGGPGLELGKPTDQNVFIGLADEKSITCLPFFQEAADDSMRFDVDAGFRCGSSLRLSFVDFRLGTQVVRINPGT